MPVGQFQLGRQGDRPGRLNFDGSPAPPQTRGLPSLFQRIDVLSGNTATTSYANGWSTAPIDLKGLTLVHSRPDDSKPSTHVMTEVTMPKGVSTSIS